MEIEAMNKTENSGRLLNIDARNKNARTIFTVYAKQPEEDHSLDHPQAQQDQSPHATDSADGISFD